MKVYVLARPFLDTQEFYRFLKDENLDSTTLPGFDEPAFIVEQAGRICYMSYGKGRRTTEDFVTNILKQQHYSVLEHANWTLVLTGVSRTFTHELVRHRHFSFSQLSQRYVDESDAKMVTPPALRNNRSMQAVYDIALEASRDAYKAIVKQMSKSGFTHKEVRQAARGALLGAVETKIVVTGNARTWREFLQKRNTPQADAEMQEVAAAIADTLKKESPILFGDV